MIQNDPEDPLAVALRGASDYYTLTTGENSNVVAPMDCSSLEPDAGAPAQILPTSEYLLTTRDIASEALGAHWLVD